MEANHSESSVNSNAPVVRKSNRVRKMTEKYLEYLKGDGKVHCRRADTNSTIPCSPQNGQTVEDCINSAEVSQHSGSGQNDTPNSPPDAIQTTPVSINTNQSALEWEWDPEGTDGEIRWKNNNYPTAPYECRYCLQGFHLESEFLEHPTDHPVTCLFCSRSFCSVGPLQRHEHQYHTVNEESEPYYCATCGVWFYFRQQWEDHQALHNLEE